MTKKKLIAYGFRLALIASIAVTAFMVLGAGGFARR